MIISHNLLAINSNRQLNVNSKVQSKSTEKLSSGYKINRSADDAAGLAISEKMRRQIRGLTQASANSQDGISMVQTAEGGLNEVHDMLQRYNELAIKASNGTLTPKEREYVNEEAEHLKREINRVADTTTFNEIQLFPSDGSSLASSSHYRINLSRTDGKISVLDEATTNYKINSEKNINSSNDLLADFIKTEIPKMTGYVLDTFTALDRAPDVNIELDISKIDKPGGTLAFAQYSYYSGSYAPDPSSFLVKVDSLDFDNGSLSDPDAKDLLVATLQHEITHTIMQNTMSKSMATEFPTWFKEGVAQLSGGGFSTGWNSTLASIMEGIADPIDTSRDELIKNYLKSDTVAGRPYGHGYLAVGYMGQLASKDATFSADSIAKGINNILGDILDNGKSFEQAVSDQTGKSVSDIVSEINHASDDAVDFVRKLTVATGKGAGSVLKGIGLSAGSQPSGGGYVPSPSGVVAAQMVALQVGSEAGQHIEVDLFSIGTDSLGMSETHLLTEEDANYAIDDVKKAISKISTIRSYYGAIQNRLEHTINNLDNVVENTTAAESQIRDTDMAGEMVGYSNRNILLQAGQSMLAQANQSGQGILSLLG